MRPTLPTRFRRSPDASHPRGGGVEAAKVRQWICGSREQATAATLDPNQSAALREGFWLRSGASRRVMAPRPGRAALGAKNSLTATDAKLVEDAFEQQCVVGARTVRNRGSRLNNRCSKNRACSTLLAPMRRARKETAILEHQPKGIDKSVLTIAAPRRYRNKEHLRHVAQQACLVCGRKPCDPHHLRFMQPRALGRKVSDEFTVPLCRAHHRAVHRTGHEAAWWKTAGIDPIKVARQALAKNPAR